MQTLVLLSVLALAVSCSADDRSATPETSVSITVKRDVVMQVGNLIQKELAPGDMVEALCIAPPPDGYPGPVVKVRSGSTVGYATVEADGLHYFDTSAAELQERLPDCGPTGLT
ncbi:hypothetical protein [Nocardioides cynanchi]|uniref:hypothetical protein n=1 Tax=Nocardioides cynanchi TaxID=2558918 RepID=UPI001245D80E|nr:hypothetical protein [Nocardioides cynanchi]